MEEQVHVKSGQSVQLSRESCAFCGSSAKRTCGLRAGLGEAVMSLFVWTCLGEGAPGLSAGEPREPSTSCLARVCTGGSLPWLCIDVSVGSTA